MPPPLIAGNHLVAGSTLASVGGSDASLSMSFFNGRQTAGRVALKICRPYVASFEQLGKEMLTGTDRTTSLAMTSQRNILRLIIRQNSVFSHARNLLPLTRMKTLCYSG